MFGRGSVKLFIGESTPPREISRAIVFFFYGALILDLVEKREICRGIGGRQMRTNTIVDSKRGPLLRFAIASLSHATGVVGAYGHTPLRKSSY
jgi:hypothetical protein